MSVMPNKFSEIDARPMFHAALCHLSDGLPVQEDGRLAVDALRDMGARDDEEVLVVAMPRGVWPAAVLQEVVSYLNRGGDPL